jgi:hypothetical protein
MLRAVRFSGSTIMSSPSVARSPVASEGPMLFAEELHAGFRSLRKSA